ncbi:hypothetical protein LCGC14_1290630 [marine sediment metagenome]|uniref:YkgJ family cysteine cluster protein n=1 Tax=marine sediment metagenome TaxID=412755 RepID=A0A0F9NVK3_9ZZZZ
MPKFECKKYHGTCKGMCCGVVPLPRILWQNKQHAIQRPVKSLIKGTAGHGPRNIVIPITEDHYCPFLKKDLSCAIYEDRPEICRKYGDESHELMCCPMQHKDGTPRESDDDSKKE